MVTISGSFCEYQSTDCTSLHKTKEIKDRKQNNSKLRPIQSYQEYKAFWCLQKDPKFLSVLTWSIVIDLRKEFPTNFNSFYLMDQSYILFLITSQ